MIHITSSDRQAPLSILINTARQLIMMLNDGSRSSVTIIIKYELEEQGTHMLCQVRWEMGHGITERMLTASTPFLTHPDGKIHKLQG
jgi:hypothetical protein